MSSARRGWRAADCVEDRWGTVKSRVGALAKEAEPPLLKLKQKEALMEAPLASGEYWETAP